MKRKRKEGYLLTHKNTSFCSKWDIDGEIRGRWTGGDWGGGSRSDDGEWCIGIIVKYADANLRF